VRIKFALALAGTVLLAGPAMAGTVTIAGGQVAWHSSQCTAPAEPSFAKPEPETPANNLNARVREYNSYASAAQDYMNCVSNEAKHDAGVVSQLITDQAENMIDRTDQRVKALGAPFQPMAPSPMAAVPATATAAAPVGVPAEPEAPTASAAMEPPANSAAPMPQAAPAPASQASPASSSSSTMTIPPGSDSAMAPAAK